MFAKFQQFLHKPLFGTAPKPEAELVLELGEGDPIDNPSATQLALELSRLTDDADSFAVLRRRTGEFVQTYRYQGGYAIEYKDAGGHFSSRNDPQSLATTTELFQRFAANDVDWKSLLNWEFDGRKDWIPHG